ncbi:MAG: hypothetical protein ABW166_08585 [Sedimenticola sp.]
MRLFDEYKIQGSFLLSLGTDHSSSFLKKRLPAGLLNYLPAPMISKRASDSLRAIRDAGHEVGLSAYTPHAWRSDTAYRNSDWTCNELQWAVDAFETLYGCKPEFYGAAGWQVNAHLLALEEELEFRFASDVRGRGPFLPLLQEVSYDCPQIPTTLPTLAELVKLRDIAHEKLHEYIFSACQRILPNGEVFSLNAGFEGRELVEVFERMLVMWKGSQWEFKTLAELFDACKDTPLPRHQIGWGEMPGGDGHLAMQSLLIDEQSTPTSSPE